MEKNILNGENSKQDKSKNAPVEKNEIKKELYWIFGIMIFCIVAVLIVYYFMSFPKQFTISGMTFSEEKYGELTFYKYYYYFNDTEGNVFQHNVYFRFDPRKNDVPVAGEIVYPQGKFVYLSVNRTGIENCEDATIATASIVKFIVNNKFEVRAATPDINESEIKEKKLRYATCETHPDNLVIIIQEGNETKIEKRGELCHVITVKNCEIVKAVEKFQIQSILDAKKRSS